MGQTTGFIGRKTISSVNHILDLFAFAYRIGGLILERPKEGRALIRRIALEQIYFTAVQALPIIIPVALIIGSMLIIQFGKISGQYDLGKIMVLLIVRELGPGITALLVILRSAVSVTIEIGYMNVFREIDTIEMTGIDPVRFICLPRLIGIITAVLCLFIIFDLVAIIGGYAVATGATQLPIANLVAHIGKAITPTDIVVGIVKAICFGIIITITSLYNGFKIKKHITKLPSITSGAAIECSVYCLIVNVIISAIFYM